MMYIGHTGKPLDVRINQHKDAVRLSHASNAVCNAVCFNNVKSTLALMNCLMVFAHEIIFF